MILTENEQTALTIYRELKDMRGDFSSSDPHELAEFAGMCLNTLIHLGRLIERAVDLNGHQR